MRYARSATVAAGLVVFGGILAGSAHADAPVATAPVPAWPEPGKDTSPGTPIPVNTKPPGTLQEIRRPYVAISTDTEKGGNSFSLSTDLLFKTGSAELSGSAQANIQAVADQLKKNGISGDVRVVGHTDNVGEPQDNQSLSERRANSVKDALGPLVPDTGINLAAEGKGESQPIASNSTDAGRAKNRRVAVVYRPNGGQSAPADSSSIAVPSTEPAPAAPNRTPEVASPIASVQRTIENHGRKWTVRLDVTEFALSGKYIKIGYLTRQINQAQSDGLYYGALFSGDLFTRDAYKATLIDKTGGEELQKVITGRGWALVDSAQDNYVGNPQYGWAYFPKPRKQGDPLSFYVPALGAIDGLKLGG